MDTDSSAGESRQGNDDYSDLVDMFKRLTDGYHTLAEETIFTEERYLEFVRLMETDVRQPWNTSEFESRRLRSEMQTAENEYTKSSGIMKNIRQQLQSEMDRRNMAEERVKELQGVLNTFREMLGGDRTLTDEERQRLYDTTEEFRRNQNDNNSNIWTGVRKSEDIDADRISFDRSDDEDIQEEEEEDTKNTKKNNQKNENKNFQKNEKNIFFSENENKNFVFSESEKSRFFSENENGDIEIIAKTRVRISEKGPVTAKTRLSARPRKSVGFSDTDRLTSDTGTGTGTSGTVSVVRRSHSVPRFVEDTDGNRLRRSREEAELLSSDGGSQFSDVNSLAGDYLPPNAQPPSTLPPLRRRSKSLGKGLDARMHSFLDKLILLGETCAVCKGKITFGNVGRRCNVCLSICHTRCEAAVPLPCLPYTSNGLVKSGGQVFELEKMVGEKRPRVPAVVTQCVRFIEGAMLEEGLYRVPGAQAAINDLKKQYYTAYKRHPQSAIIPNLAKVRDVNIVCGFLTKFIMTLKEPLLTYQLWQRFSTAASAASNTDIYKLIDQLPVPNRDTLASLMLHFHRVVKTPAVRMSSENMQRILAPSLIGYSAPPDTLPPSRLQADLLRQQLIISKLFSIKIHFWSELMQTEPKRSSFHEMATPLDDSSLQYYDAPEDSMVMEGGAGMRGIGNSSFSKLTRSFFSGSSSKTTIGSESKSKATTSRPPPKFQSPFMSD